MHRCTVNKADCAFNNDDVGQARVPYLGETDAPKGSSSSVTRFDSNERHVVKSIADEECRKTKRARKETLTCSKCLVAKNEEKFSSKQWGRGVQGKRRKVYCRRCEEKCLVRQRVGLTKEKLCIRINTKTSRIAKAKCIATMIPLNSETSFLPSELTLNGYTREPWSLKGGEFDTLWQIVILSCIVGNDKVVEFVDFLNRYQKSAYGTFLLKDGNDGFFFVPYYEQPRSRSRPADDEGKPSATLVCKYILGLNLSGQKTNEERFNHHHYERNNDSEDYISPSLLGSLLLAQSKTDCCLADVPRGSVKTAPKLNNNISPSKKSNVTKDWFRPRLTVKEDNG